jgi:hypothetical protein
MGQVVRIWLLLTYKVPRNPTANRVYVWRKLKQLGAVLVNDALWVLPSAPQSYEHCQWLGAEIEELGGEFALWESRLMLKKQEESLVLRFANQVEGPYRKILAELKRSRPDLTALSRRYQQIRARDYFNSELGKQVLKTLMRIKGESKL